MYKIIASGMGLISEGRSFFPIELGSNPEEAETIWKGTLKIFFETLNLAKGSVHNMTDPQRGDTDNLQAQFNNLSIDSCSKRAPKDKKKSQDSPEICPKSNDSRLKGENSSNTRIAALKQALSYKPYSIKIEDISILFNILIANFTGHPYEGDVFKAPELDLDRKGAELTLSNPADRLPLLRAIRRLSYRIENRSYILQNFPNQVIHVQNLFSALGNSMLKSKNSSITESINGYLLYEFLLILTRILSVRTDSLHKKLKGLVSPKISESFNHQSPIPNRIFVDSPMGAASFPFSNPSQSSLPGSPVSIPMSQNTLIAELDKNILPSLDEPLRVEISSVLTKNANDTQVFDFIVNCTKTLRFTTAISFLQAINQAQDISYDITIAVQELKDSVDIMIDDNLEEWMRVLSNARANLAPENRPNLIRILTEVTSLLYFCENAFNNIHEPPLVKDKKDTLTQAIIDSITACTEKGEMEDAAPPGAALLLYALHKSDIPDAVSEAFLKAIVKLKHDLRNLLFNKWRNFNIAPNNPDNEIFALILQNSLALGALNEIHKPIFNVDDMSTKTLYMIIYKKHVALRNNLTVKDLLPYDVALMIDDRYQENLDKLLRLNGGA